MPETSHRDPSRSLRHNHSFLGGLHMALRVCKTEGHDTFVSSEVKGYLFFRFVLFCFVYLPFLGPLLRYMEVLKLGV